jgi:hypothetical protein
MSDAEADDAFAAEIAAIVVGLFIAVERGKELDVIGGINNLLHAMVERRNARSQALARALERV